MTSRAGKARPPFAQTAVRIFTANERMNQIVIESLDPAIWTVRPQGNVRSIAALFTHMHNMRAKWIRLTAPQLGVPARLHRTDCTQEQARAGLAVSAARCAEMLAELLGAGEGRTARFHRDALAAPWPAGPEMLAYMLAHEAHHRGQACMLAHQLARPLPSKVMAGIWNWEKLWRESGGKIGGR